MHVVMAFYLFADWPRFADIRSPLKDYCAANGVTGSILLAFEGINGTVAGSQLAVDGLMDWLRAVPEIADLPAKYSVTDAPPFRRMRVRLKKEIVPLGIEGVDVANTGTYVEPEDWGALIADPTVVVIDTRNNYEIAIGSFPGALNPGTGSFRDFPDWVASAAELENKPRVAMFCTGGIRCEKASAYLRDQGFGEVYQLHGGILRYLEEVPAEDTAWQGECYVFDGRVSVGPGLVPGDCAVCPNCNAAVGAAARSTPGYQAGVTCPACVSTITADRRARFSERQRQIELAHRRGEAHLGQEPIERQLA